MAKDNQIILNQVDLSLDELISHLCSLKKTVADMREKMANVSTPALGNGILPDEQVAALLNRREKTLAKKFH